MTARRRVVASALRDMADRLETGRVYAMTMQSAVDVLVPNVVKLPDGSLDVGALWPPKSKWEGIVSVDLPEGTLDNE